MLGNGAAVSAGTVSKNLVESSAQAVLGSISSVSIFEGEVPAFVEAAVAKLYGSLFSSFDWFRVYGGIEGASTYVERRDGRIAAIFLFRLENGAAKVLNEGMPVDTATVERFAAEIFTRYASVDCVTFHAVDSLVKTLQRPFQQYHCTEDSVVSLPGTPEEYFERFGKSMRRNLKYYLNRLQRDFPSYEYRIWEGKDVDERYIRGIVGLNRLRFSSTNRVSAITKQDEDRIVRMIRACGIVGVAMIDGELCAGSLTYRVGDHCYSWLKAHDPKYDDYRFGIILSYLMVSECIRRSAKVFHFMWGRQPQKALLQGEHRDMSHLVVYRSSWTALKKWRQGMRLWIGSLLREFGLWLRSADQRQDKWSVFALKVVKLARQARNLLRKRNSYNQ
jgi:hypothetical protein